MEYKVTWTIEVDADSPEQAAQLALEIQRDTLSLATHFSVRGEDGTNQEIELVPDKPASPREIYVCVPMDDGFVRYVQAFTSRSSAERAQQEWRTANELTEETAIERSADWGTSFTIMECELMT